MYATAVYGVAAGLLLLVCTVVVLAEPVSATLLAWLVLAELPAPGFWLAAPLVLVGVAVSLARPPAAQRSGAGPAQGGSPPGGSGS